MGGLAASNARPSARISIRHAGRPSSNRDFILHASRAAARALIGTASDTQVAAVGMLADPITKGRSLALPAVAVPIPANRARQVPRCEAADDSSGVAEKDSGRAAQSP